MYDLVDLVLLIGARHLGQLRLRAGAVRWAVLQVEGAILLAELERTHVRRWAVRVKPRRIVSVRMHVHHVVAMVHRRRLTLRLFFAVLVVVVTDSRACLAANFTLLA